MSYPSKDSVTNFIDLSLVFEREHVAKRARVGEVTQLASNAQDALQATEKAFAQSSSAVEENKKHVHKTVCVTESKRFAKFMPSHRRMGCVRIYHPSQRTQQRGLPPYKNTVHWFLNAARTKNSRQDRHRRSANGGTSRSGSVRKVGTPYCVNSEPHELLQRAPSLIHYLMTHQR